MKELLLNIDHKIDTAVTLKIQQQMNIDNDSTQWTIKEQKILDIIDTQGKDIAVDFSKIEQLIEMIQSKLDSGTLNNPTVFSENGQVDSEQVKNIVDI